MEILDEYQEHPCAVAAGQSDVTGNAAAAAAAAAVVANMASIAAGMAHHRHNSESPMSHQEEDLSDPDRQDEESGEELPQQPLQGTSHSSAENTPTQTPLAHLNSLMSQQHPHFMAKIKLENDPELLGTKSGIEALQAAITSGGFNLPFSFPPPPNFLNPNTHGNSLMGQSNRDSSSGAVGNSNFINNAGSTSHNNGGSSASSHTSESSQSSGKNGLEITSLRDSGIGAGGGGGGGGGSAHGQSSSQGGGQGQQQHQQQTSWSFEEQFKQLYEINDDPKRKEFLDDLFSYMQKKVRTPINRLPIMAKSVLDLYELYNLVIARGGLVDVINKKLWQEIIKGLHLPSSITSAAFTLRTQYMKYLYPYECEKKHLSTPTELQAAIDGNRREGRRSNYGAYGGAGPDVGIQRSSHTPSSLASLHQISPMSLVSTLAAAGAAASGQHQVNPQALVNGSAAHTPMPHHPHHPQHQQAGLGQTPSAGIAPDFEVRMAEYVKQLHRGMNPQMHHQQQQQQLLPHQQDNGSPPSQSTSPSHPDNNALFEMSRLSLWNSIYNNNLHPSIAAAAAVANAASYNHQPISPRPASHSPQAQTSTPEPQKEALDLGMRSSPSSSSPAHQSPPSSSGGSVRIKREMEASTTGNPAAKRICMEEEASEERNPPALPNTHIRIANRGDGRDNSLVVSMELNGVMYEGVLFAQPDGRNGSASMNNNEVKAPSRNIIS